MHTVGASVSVLGQDAAVPSVDLVDETFVVAHRDRVAAIVADPQRWQQWWPDLLLTVFMDRGPAGIRWSITGALVGSCEIWLEAVGDGVLIHYYLRADQPSSADPRVAAAPPANPADWRRAARLRAQRATSWKSHVWALKDELEAGRVIGSGTSIADRAGLG